MTNVVFDKVTLKVTGENRSPLPFEVEIKNVDPSGLMKTISVIETVGKKDVDGNQIYLFTPKPKVEVVTKGVRVENTAVSPEPVIELVTEKIAVLNEDGTPTTYLDGGLHETTIDTGIPSLVFTEEGEVQRIDSEGNPIFLEHMMAVEIPCYTTKEVEIFKKDAKGNQLYVNYVPEKEMVETSYPTVEITALDEQYEDGLKEVTEDVSVSKTTTYKESPKEFTYDEVLACKESQLAMGTFYQKGLLLEKVDPAKLSTDLVTFNADLGFNVISIPDGGQFRTEKLTLPMASKYVNVTLDASSAGLEVKIGNLSTDLQLLDALKERVFASEVTEVYVQVRNATGNRIDVKSIAILV